MIADIYTRLQGTATSLLERFTQGTVTYISPPVKSGTSFNPVITPGDRHDLQYVKAQGRALQTYIAGGFVRSTDLVIIIPVAPVQIELAGLCEIEGQTYQIIMADPITLDPATPVVWHIGLRR